MKRKRKQNSGILPALIVVLWVILVGLVALMLVPEKKPDPNLNSHSGTTAQTQPETKPTEPPVTDPPETEPPTGWQEADGKRYFLLEDGSRATGWMDLGGSRYYLDPSGWMQTGWLEWEGNTYYLRDDGTMARGQVEIDGRNHFFTSTGAETLMVNPWNFLPEDYELDLKLLGSDVALEDMWVQSDCYDALIEMIYDCNAAMEEMGTGSLAYVLSAYRTHEHQTSLYTSKVQLLMSQGYSREDAERNAAMVNAYPGTSEHQLGLAVDIIDNHLWKLVEAQADLPAQKWLMENSWRYGFILRFPKGKTEYTGIIFEPWHYRYVGKELAKELYESGLTMEEYMASLS